jgi:alkylated DNA repair dioxygenase AlkB/23S rRNA G2445 N2-methylase RlmL
MDEFLVRELETPCVYHDSEFLSEEQADSFYATLRKQIPWEKTAKINRWVRLYQEAGDDAGDAAAYAYKDAPQQHQEGSKDDNNNTANSSDDLTNVNGFPELVQDLRRLCQDWYASKICENGNNDPPPAFNVCLLNFYEDGQQRIGWHSDREEIGRTTPIASVSLGAPRKFLVRSQNDGRKDRASLQLTSGSIVVMEPSCQTNYLHSVPKEAEVTSGRINLTFRCKDFAAEAEETTQGEELHERRETFIDKLVKDGAKPRTLAWTSGNGGGTADNDNDAAFAGNALQPQSPSFVFGEEPSTTAHDDEFAPFELKFLVRTNMGAEGYCAAEIRERLSDLEGDTSNWTVLTRPFGFDGYIGLFCPNVDDCEEAKGEYAPGVAVRNELLQLKTAHHVLNYRYHFMLKDCFPFVHQYDAEADLETLKEERIPKEALYEHVKKQLLNNSISFLPTPSEGNDDEKEFQKMTFRVTNDRVGGPHAWQSPEVEYEIGGAFAEVYGDRYKWKPKMTDYDLHIRADVIGKIVVMGIQLNVHDLSKGRHFARFRNAVTIKTNLAYAMIRLANIQQGNTVLDPFCGSGTLLLEALDMYQGKLKDCLGMDVSRRSANGARENAIAEGYSGKGIVRFVCSDARSLRRHVDADGTVDAVVTNLPWGIMTGQNQSVSSLQTLYEVFLRNAWYVLRPGGRIVMLVLRGLQVMRIVRKLSGRFKLVHVNVVRTTNNLPCIVVVEKLPDDEIRDSIKGQLAHLNQYVNVSPEIYRCIHTEDVDEDFEARPAQKRQAPTPPQSD